MAWAPGDVLNVLGDHDAEVSSSGGVGAVVLAGSSADGAVVGWDVRSRRSTGGEGLEGFGVRR